MPKRKGKAAKEAKGTVLKKKKAKGLNDDFLLESESEEEEDMMHGKQKDGEDSEDSEEEPEETADEKRIRMAKEYLKSLELDGDDGLGDDDGNDAIAHRLQQDILEEQGTLQRDVAQSFANTSYSASDVRIHRGHRLPPTCLALARDDSIAVTGSKDGSIIRWDVATGAKTTLAKHGSKEAHAGQVLSVALSDDGTFLASGGCDGVVKIWDIRSNSVVEDFRGHRDKVAALAFRRNSNELFSGSHDRTIRVWNLDSMGFVEQLFGHQSPVTCLDSLFRDRALSCAADKTLRLWKIVEETQLLYEGGHISSIDCGALLTEESYFTGGQDGRLCLWLAKKKKPSSTRHRAHGGEWITAVATHTYSDLLASGSSDGYIRLWCANNERLGKDKLKELTKIPVTGFVNGLRISNECNFVVAAVGQEHRLGRWKRIPEARNGLQVIQLKENEDEDKSDEDEDREDEDANGLVVDGDVDEDEGDDEGEGEGEGDGEGDSEGDGIDEDEDEDDDDEEDEEDEAR